MSVSNTVVHEKESKLRLWPWLELISLVAVTEDRSPVISQERLSEASHQHNGSSVDIYISIHTSTRRATSR